MTVPSKHEEAEQGKIKWVFEIRSRARLFLVIPTHGPILPPLPLYLNPNRNTPLVREEAQPPFKGARLWVAIVDE